MREIGGSDLLTKCYASWLFGREKKLPHLQSRGARGRKKKLKRASYWSAKRSGSVEVCFLFWIESGRLGLGAGVRLIIHLIARNRSDPAISARPPARPLTRKLIIKSCWKKKMTRKSIPLHVQKHSTPSMPDYWANVYFKTNIFLKKIRDILQKKLYRWKVFLIWIQWYNFYIIYFIFS
jgi:hypothetical protein